MDPTILTLGRPLPVPSRIIARTRDILVLQLPSVATHPVSLTNTAIIFDLDGDLRILDVLVALHHKARHIRANVIGLAESKGRVKCWYGDHNGAQLARIRLQEAATSALWPYDNWIVEPLILAPMDDDGTLNRGRLGADDSLRAVPDRYTLGLVQP